ncbi:MAG TPA: heavy metal-associated domain-containing protein [Novimethylophilus sp.]|uniref:heavy-metal-associated domain-containing protein n=1 Tax=Novimethylophilus sp. TaxID=2137426 RepID=UPI002F3FB77A
MKIRTIRQRMAIALILILFTSSALAAQAAWLLRVDGLSCPFCAYGIEKKLGAVKGVQRVEVDIASGTVTVTMAEDAALDAASAQKAVQDAGFSLRSLEQIRAAPQGKLEK